MDKKADIIKSAAIIIKDKKLLFNREHGEQHLSIVGGGIKEGEDPVVCLKRELREELGISNFTIEDSEPFYITPLAPAASQPDKLVQMLCYRVTLHEEPKMTYNADHPVEGEDIEELVWVGSDDLEKIERSDGSFSVKYRSNPKAITLTHSTEEYLFPKLIALGMIDMPK